MEPDEDWRKYVKEADIYYKLSEQMKQSQPLIAYFSNLHGLRKVTHNMPKKADKKLTKRILKYLNEKTQILEEMKPSLDISKKAEGKEIFEEFIHSALAKVDKNEKDKSQTIDQQMAKNFMTIALLIEVMETFDALSEEWQERKQYCIFKAGHIMQMINKGK